MDSASFTLFTTTAAETPTAEMPILIPKQPTQPIEPPQPTRPPRPSQPAIPTPRTRVRHPLAGRHALVVGINYAPEPTGIAPYTTGMAEHLAEHADSVSVLTGVPHYPNWRLDQAYRWVLRTKGQSTTGTTHGSGPRIRRLRHYVPGTQNAITRAGYEATFLLNALSTRVEQRPDVVIAVTPSLGGAVAGARLAKRHGSKLIVVVQDLMAKAANQSGIRGGSYAARATGAIERYALTRADRVAVVSDAFRGQLHEYGVQDEKISLLPNWTHISQVDLTRQDARRALGWPVEPFTVVHTGNIGLKQDLGNLVEAAWQCRSDPSIRFVIVGDGSQRPYIEAQGADLPNLTFVDPLDGEQYPKALAAADLLVVNERPGVGDMSLPSKLTSYLSAGRPVLAAVAENGATAQELALTAGAAEIVPPGDPAAVVEAVMNLRRDDLKRTQMAKAGKYYADNTLGRDAAARRLDALVEECLNLS
jgi:colanic acid biosynthesis glycosyl transferase WcaI